MMPAAAPPSIIPTSPEANAVANDERVRPQSAMIAGSAMPSIWLSAPSKMMVSAVSSTRRCWYAVHRPSSSSRPTSRGAVFIDA
jgi:hypothetical protein